MAALTGSAAAARLDELQEAARSARLAAAATRRESRAGVETLHWHARRLRRALRHSVQVLESSDRIRPLAWSEPGADLGDVLVLLPVRTDDGA